MAKVYRRPAARRDLVVNYVYLFEHAGGPVADRFLQQAQASFDDLAARPLIGAPVVARNPVLADLRKWRVNDFDSYLIFYRPRRDGVSIVRVLHAAQDQRRLLGLDETPDN